LAKHGLEARATQLPHATEHSKPQQTTQLITENQPFFCKKTKIPPNHPKNNHKIQKKEKEIHFL